MEDWKIKALASKYLKIKAEKKAAEKADRKAKRKAEKKAASRERMLIANKAKRKEKRKILFYQLSEKRKERARQRHRTKVRRRRAQHRYYIRHVKRPRIRRRLHRGDEMGSFVIFLAKNKKQIKKVANFKWKFNAVQRFNGWVEDNHNKTIFPVQYENETPNYSGVKVEYEILIKKRIDSKNENNETVFRDEMGINTIVKTDNPQWLIISKEQWFIEEDFYLFGYHPKRDRKTAEWTIEHVIHKNLKENNLCRIFLWHNYVFFENDSDFTFAVLKSSREAIRLYNILYDRLKDCENIFFTGTLTLLSSKTWVEKMKDKTGWDERTVRRGTPVV